MNKLFNIYEYESEADLNDFIVKIDQAKAVLLSVQANMKATDMKCFTTDEQKVLLACVAKLLNLKENKE